MAEQLTIKIKPRMDEISEDHPAFAQSTEELISDLHGLSGIAITERDQPYQGSAGKGVLQDLFIVPGSAGAALAAVKVLKLWLSRDRRRSIDITITRPDNTELKVQASGDSLSLETFEKTVSQALRSDKR